MKEVKSTVVKYVACDGKEFKDDRECYNYEADIFLKKENKVYIPGIDFMGDVDVYLVKFNTKEDFKMFDEFVTGHYVDGYYNAPDKYPFYGVFVAYDGNYCDIYDYDGVMEDMCNSLSKMIAFKRKEN